jgi:superoxide reductase
MMTGSNPQPKERNMTQRLEIYKCSVCGNIVEVLHAGASSLVCCGEEMKLMAENSVDASQEKHVPVIEVGATSITVKIGSVPHPMEEKHYIEWIELIADNKSYTHFLKPGDAPEATFPLTAKKVTAREYCNLHGQWKSEL